MNGDNMMGNDKLDSGKQGSGTLDSNDVCARRSLRLVGRLSRLPLHRVGVLLDQNRLC